MTKRMVIFGLGYTAQAFAQQAQRLGFDCVGTTRQSGLGETGYSGVKAINFFAKDVEDYLSQADYLLISTPPTPDQGDPVLSLYGDMIKKYADQFQWVGYLSSTSVYGDHQGKWVDEASDCHPHTASGSLRLQAEQAWMAYAKSQGLPLHLFRLAGIYGPSRNCLHRIDAGKPYSVYKEGQFFSRIHVADIVSVLMASLQAPSPLSIYNVADDEPCGSHLVDAYAAVLLHREPLPLLAFEQAPLSAMEKEFYANNRRVSNLTIKQELQVGLQYPTFREGLAQLYMDEFMGAKFEQ